MEVFDERPTEDAVPPVERGQLLRGLTQLREEPGDTREGLAGPPMPSMRTADVQRGTPGVGGLTPIAVTTMAGW